MHDARIIVVLKAWLHSAYSNVHLSACKCKSLLCTLCDTGTSPHPCACRPVAMQISPDAKDLIKRLLRRRPHMRYKLEQVEAHPWIQRYKHTVAPHSEYMPKALAKELAEPLQAG